MPNVGTTYTPLGGLAESTGPTPYTVPFVPDRRIQAPAEARSIPLLVGAQPNQVYLNSYGSETPVSLHFSNSSPTAAFTVIQLDITMAANFGATSTLVTALGPGEGITIPVAGLVSVTAQTSLINVNLLLWTTFQPLPLQSPPRVGQHIGLGTPAWTPLAPSGGFAPGMNLRWVNIYSTANFDMQIQSGPGVIFCTMLNQVGLSDPIILPPGMQIFVRANAGNINLVSTWTTKRNW